MSEVFCQDPRRAILSSVKRPSRYIGCEYGTGSVKDGNLLRVCYAFPDVYEVGMSYLGFQILYGLTKELPFADAERVYAPWPDFEDALRNTNTELWALESKRPIKEFDVVAFTLQYELCYTNVLTILDLGNIPHYADERKDSDPLVIAGGPCALTPAPVEPFFDAFIIGDGEIVNPEVYQILFELKGRSRTEKLAALSKIEGVYVPMYPSDKPVRRRIAERLDDVWFNTKMIVPNTSIVHDRITLQVFKGCTRGCRFCQAGMIDRPVRERSVESVLEQTDLLLKNTGWEEIGLLSLATCDWTGLLPFIRSITPELEKQQTKLSLPSLRVDAFSVQLAAELHALRKSGLTFAPEAGTQRLRNVINKGVTEDDIANALEQTFANGWDRVKLYFMMGLPTETEEDLSGILDICGQALTVARKYKRKGEISVSLAGFVPKGHTPFQWEAQLDRESLHERGSWVKHQIRSKKISLAYHEPKQTYLEGVFARGDSSLAPVIEEVWRRGQRFDGWTEYFNFDRWMEVFADLGIDSDKFVAARSLDEKLPWENIDCGVSKQYLLRERDNAMNGIVTKDCRKGCNGCGWQGKVGTGNCNA